MEVIIVIVIIYIIFLFADIIPKIKKKQVKAMWFSIPIFVITLIMNVMMQFGVEFISPSKIIEKAVRAILPK